MTRHRASTHHGAREERGAVLILVALILTALLVVAALVIDMSFVRQNRQTDKSAADFAAAAGIRSLDNGSGRVQPWRGICAAADFLRSNADELSTMAVTFTDGGGDPVEDASGDEVADPCAAPPATICTSSPATWGTLTGTADGGRIRVTIRNGYPLPDPAFPEDDGEYSGDFGDGPCDNLAVIIEEGEASYFGGAAGASGYETTIRSVSRLTQGTTGDVPAALVMLERHDCEVLEVSGTTAVVRIEGSGPNPGVIHADSLGDGGSCSTIFRVDGTTPPPRIVAIMADEADPDTGVRAPGQISAVSLSGASDAEPANTSPGVDAVCAQEVSTDCGSTGTGLGPVARDLVGRVRVDERYRVPIRGLRDRAAARLAWDEAAALAAGFTTVACDAPGPFEGAKIWIDCGGGVFRGGGKTFESTVDEVVINGYVTFSGPGTLHLVDVEKLFISGRAGGNSVVIGNDNNVFVNDGGLLDEDASDGETFVCDDRLATPTARAQVVIGQGRLSATGGELRLCQATLLMMDASDNCPVPDVDGLAPYDNGCAGNLSISGGSRTDWTAPNVNDTSPPTEAQLLELEDLAFWSETQGGSGPNAWGILGGGGVRLAGIFFTPNADPFRIGGGGLYDIRDAQFITRKLDVAGGGTLTMKPSAANAIPIPVLGGFTLVR